MSAGALRPRQRRCLNEVTRGFRVQGFGFTRSKRLLVNDEVESSRTWRLFLCPSLASHARPRQQPACTAVQEAMVTLSDLRTIMLQIFSDKSVNLSMTFPNPIGEE